MLAVSVMVMVGLYMELDHNQVGTTATILLIAVGLMVMYHISAPLNKFRFSVMGLSLAGVVLSIAFLPKLFALTMITPKTMFILLVLFFAATTVFRWLSKVLDGVSEVMVVYDQKGQATTLAELKAAYDKGKKQIN